MQAELNLLDELRHVAERLQSAKRGTKTTVAENEAQRLGYSVKTLYRVLKEYGLSNSNRKKRADAGKTCVSDDAIQAVAAMRATGVRKNGKQIMPATVAKSIALQNGYEINVSTSTVNRLLRRDNLSNEQLAQASPHTALRSLHPNHVHQVDPSLCVLYYTPKGEQHVMDHDMFYKNKLDNYNKVQNKCWRYVLTDHTSSTVIVRYYEGAGESTTNLWDFLCYAWQKLDGRPFQGVPRLLLWDKGSANMSGAIKNALTQLEVERIEHAPGAPRVKGQVENANDLVETQFEGRLKLEPVNSVDELNERVNDWYNAYNANSIPHQDTRLKRRGMSEPAARYGIWQMIRAEQLRLLPNLDVCRAILHHVPLSRTVKGDYTVTFVHPQVGKSLAYSLADMDGVIPKCKVMVSALYFGNAAVRVVVTKSNGDEVTHHVEPVEFDQFGFPVTAPIIGESYHSAKDSVVEKAKKAADKTAYPDMDQEQIKKAKNKQQAPFGGKLNAHSYLTDAADAAPTYMQKQGTEIQTPDAPKVQPIELSRVEFKQRVLKQILRPFTPQEIEYLNGLTDTTTSNIDSVVELFKRGLPARAELRVVNS